MAIGCGAKLSKALLFIINIIFWLGGLGLIVVGSIYASNTTFKDLNTWLDAESLKAVAWILIGFGIAIFLIGFCGCCGAIRESKCLLGIYIAFVGLFLVLQLAMGIYVAVKYKSLYQQIETLMKKGITEKYNTANTDFMKAVDALSKTFKCCGVTGVKDFKNSSIKPPMCSEKPDMGCLTMVQQKFNEALPAFLGILFGIFAFQLLVFIMAIVLCRNRGSDTEYA